MEKELLYRPNLLLINHFLKINEVSASRKEISEMLEKVERPLTLFSISNILREFGVEAAIYKIDFEQISKLTSSFLTIFEEDSKKKFIVIESINDAYITFCAPNTGIMTVETVSLKSIWSGLVLYPLSIETKIEPPIDSIQIAIENYQLENVKVIDAFFTKEECEYMISYTEENNLFQQSPLANEKGAIFYSDFRTSFTSIIKEDKDPFFDKIYQKVVNFLDVPRSHIEYLECVRYSKGQEFRPHWDTNDNNEDRTHTIVVYLNDDFDGGETYFPTLNYKITPKKGRVLYFRDRDDKQNIIPYSLHAGLPVNKGIKYACNIWVRNTPIPEKHYLETGILA
jgi:2OG-Fe(II) oxygenase superfamily/Peptidase C39 family